MIDDKPFRKAVLYGVMGGQVNVTDGRYVYMRGHVTEDNTPLYDYTLMPTHMRSMFTPGELQQWNKFSGFSFLKGCDVMKIPTRTPKINLRDDNPIGRGKSATLLFDVQTDPGQTTPLDDREIESSMIELMIREMARNECPEEQYERLGLPRPKRTGNGHSDNVLGCRASRKSTMPVFFRHRRAGFKRARGQRLPKMPFQKIGWGPRQGLQRELSG